MQTERPGSLKDRFEGFGAEPTDQLWNAIESSLDEPKRKKRLIFWWWFGGFAAGILTLIGMYQLGYQQGKKQETTFKDDLAKVELKQESGNHDHGSEDKSSLTQDAHSAETDNQPSLNEDISSGHPEISPVRQVPEKISLGPLSNPQLLAAGRLDGRFSKDAPAKLSAQCEFADSSAAKEIPVKEEWEEAVIPVKNIAGEVRKKSCKYWDLGLELATWKSPNSGDQLLESPNALWADQAPESLVDNSGVITSFSPSSGAVLGGISRPLTLDLTGRYHFTCRWALETGLGYALFKTNNSYVAGSPPYVNSSYHCLSVPARISFDYVQLDKWDFSVRTGVVNEFPFLERDVIPLISTQSEETVSSGVHGYMGAADLHLDFSFTPGNYLSFYLSPGFKYYFLQSVTSSQSILKRNSWYGVSAGIRWEF